MINFEFSNTTEIVFGKGTQEQVGEKIRKYSDCNKVLVVYGSDRIKKNGLFDAVSSSLKQQKIDILELGGVKPNPRLSLVRRGIEICRNEKIDFILAIGGGSAIDTAKAIGVGVPYEGDVWDFYLGKDTPKKTLKTAVICTIPAAGSESSLSSVITNEDGWYKKSINLDLIRPVFAIINPELTFTLPAYQIGCGVVDMMTHIMERYFTNTTHVDLTDRLCEAALRSIIANGEKTLKEPENYDARAEVMWAGSLSHNGLTGCGTDGGDWATHKLEHELGGMFDVAHGAGLAAIWGSWARYVCGERIERFVQFAEHVMGVEPQETEQKTAEAGIAAMEDFYREIHMPTSLSELGIAPTEEQIKELAEKCNAAVRGNLGKVKHLDVEDMIAIYTAAK